MVFANHTHHSLYPVFVQHIVGRGAHNHKVVYPTRWVWYRPTGIDLQSTETKHTSTILRRIPLEGSVTARATSLIKARKGSPET